MNQVNPFALIGAVITAGISGLTFASALGALFWRMRAAEARIRVVEKGQAEDRKAMAELTAQLERLEGTLEGLSENVKTLTQLLMGRR